MAGACTTSLVSAVLISIKYQQYKDNIKDHIQTLDKLKTCSDICLNKAIEIIGVRNDQYISERWQD